jgi:hypothetical protein
VSRSFRANLETSVATVLDECLPRLQALAA